MRSPRSKNNYSNKQYAPTDNMSQQSQATNNAAIRLIQEGRHEEARELLRDALEMRLNGNDPQQAALLRNSLLRCVTPDNTPPSPAHGITDANENAGSSARRNGGGGGGDESSASQHTQHHQEQQPRRRSDLALFTIPFAINPNTAAVDTAVIVFNMALSYHLQDRTAWKARLFYEVSATLQVIRGARLELLDMATMNNLSVWYAENNNDTTASSQFAASVRAARASAALTSTLVESILRNLRLSTEAAARDEQQQEEDGR